MERDGGELVSILPFTFFATIGYTIILRREFDAKGAEHVD
jgi:hypothetical protein